MQLLQILSIFIGLSVLHTTYAALWNETYPKGSVVRVGEFDVYSVGQPTRSISIIVIYDIRGFNISQTRVFCDRLASQYSIHVVMPDFFRGTAAPGGDLMAAWSATVGNWTRVSTDLRNVADWLQRNYSVSKIGLVGFCWGGLQVIRACSNLSSLFFTGVSIHGSGVSVSEVSALQKPMLFIAANGDPALRPNISDAIAAANPSISPLCEYKTYDKVRHGFAAAGANYSDPDNVAAIDDVHQTVRGYFDKILSSSAVANVMSLSLLAVAFFSLTFA